MSTARGAKGSLGPTRTRGTESNTNGRGVWHVWAVCKVLRTGVQFAGAELNIRMSQLINISQELQEIQFIRLLTEETVR